MENIKYIVTILLSLFGTTVTTEEIEEFNFPDELPSMIPSPIVEEIDREGFEELKELIIQSIEVRQAAEELVGLKGDCYWIASKFCESYYGVKLKEGTLTKISYEEALPGDIVHYKNNGLGHKHWAVYLGDDEALHGNFNGKTIIYSVYLKNASDPIFYRFSK